MLWNLENTIWLFDYDLTLYGEEERFVLDSLDKRISLFVKRITKTSLAEASKIRTDYLHEFGTTLSGLQAKHQVNPEEFFDFIHEPEFLIYPKFAPEKRELLLRVKGRRLIFTNGRGDWSLAGLKSMGIADLFEAIFDLKQMNWEGKPHESAYKKIAQFLNTKNQIILLDDSLKNLEVAHHLGWKTILVNPNIQAPSWLDLQVHHLLDLQEFL